MNVEIVNAVFGYFETLYEINFKLIKLCGTDSFTNYDNDERLILNIIQDIFRIFPYKYDNETNNLILDNRSGLLEFKNDLTYLQKDFSEILERHSDFLDSIRQIRNKYEHKMHDVKIVGAGDGSFTLFDFVIGKSNITLYSKDFINILIELNAVYSKIQHEIDSYAKENNKTNYPYYRKLTRLDFNDFSKIYQDDNLRLIGKLMHVF